MVHILNPLIALQIGEAESILLQKIAAFLSGKSHNLKEKEGKWIYNSLKAWKENHFPHWSMHKIRKTIKSLESKNLIKSYKANAKKWNQTKWYSINESEYIDLMKKIFNVKYLKNRATNPYDEFQQMYNITKRNYTKDTKVSSYLEKSYCENSSKKESKTKPTQNFHFKKELIIKMIDIWNEVFKCSLNPIKAYSNRTNEKKLFYIFKTYFLNDLDKWRKYAFKVNSSQFLMGEKKTKNNFKAVFSWLIKEETIEKILNGEYGVGDRELDINNISKNIEEKKKEIVNKMDKKISEYMKIKINDKEEREKFTEYVRSASITEDDSYGVLKNIIKQVPKNYILEREEYKEIKENIYESYVMKKYLGYTKLNIREKMRESTKKIDEIDNVEEKIRVLKEIEERIKIKECVASNLQGKREIGSYSSGLLESIFLSNPKKESRYLKGSSKESSIRDLVI